MHECAHRLLSIAVSPAPSSETQALMHSALQTMRIRAERQSHGRIRARATVRAIADFVNIAYISVPPWVIEEGGWTRDDGVGR